MIIDAFNDLNWLAVAASAVAAFAIGLVWFAPQVLGTLWAREVSQYAGTPAADVESRAAKGGWLLNCGAAVLMNVVAGAILGVWK